MNRAGEARSGGGPEVEQLGLFDGLTHDQLSDGRSLRLFNVLVDFKREGLAIEIDLSLPSARVIRSLEQIEWRGKPKVIRCDNGPKYVSGAPLGWAERQGILVMTQ